MLPRKTCSPTSSSGYRKSSPRRRGPRQSRASTTCSLRGPARRANSSPTACSNRSTPSSARPVSLLAPAAGIRYRSSSTSAAPMQRCSTDSKPIRLLACTAPRPAARRQSSRIRKPCANYRSDYVRIDRSKSGNARGRSAVDLLQVSAMEPQGSETSAMEPRGGERRLSAILAADMVGYSRLMEADETGTLARLRTHRLELIDPVIAKNKGHIIKTTGDGMLVEFQSVADAVECAAEIQRRMARRNTDVSPARRIQYRIGINLGDVIVEDGDIFGDGVNVAARLQELAAPNGICVSAAVRDQVGDRLDVAFEDLGEQCVKNIVRPIRIFRVLLDKESRVRFEGVSPEPGPATKPSLVVLPFVNMSGDPEQEFFVDGLSEDIITELSRFRDLLVISRNSAFVHKGKAVKVQDIAREFGVHYVVEGSVRKAGDRVRVTVQLIDAETDRHIWAERYDRKIEDIFAIQDEVTRAIVGTLPGRIEAAGHDRAKRKPPQSMVAYEYVLTGKILHHRSTREDNAEAQRMLDRAITLDPKYAHAHAWMAWVLAQTLVYNWCEDRRQTWKQVVDEAHVALGLDDNDSDVHRVLAAVNLAHDEHEKAKYHQ